MSADENHSSPKADLPENSASDSGDMINEFIAEKELRLRKSFKKLGEELETLQDLQARMLKSAEMMEKRIQAVDDICYRLRESSKTTPVETERTPPKAVPIDISDAKNDEQEEPTSVSDELSALKGMYSELVARSEKMGQEMAKRPQSKINESNDENDLDEELPDLKRSKISTDI